MFLFKLGHVSILLRFRVWPSIFVPTTSSPCLPVLVHVQRSSPIVVRFRVSTPCSSLGALDFRTHVNVHV
ncbi:hypothetical protein M378DRAFT_162223 [Amanita muscaria Koide BX008]|uniref:Uncharacterized protein n=1 Tax=Amanita muscaria (strain Koide BX008) TaxID=946122 RepID=A0A0C2X933_AMAMK|nr:hypothetical protein M378DRAFT_162223 [Amanita muscaria Koide BX008]